MKRYRQLGLAVVAASLMAALPLVVTAQDADGKKVCYAFQDLSTGFWVAGHGTPSC